jgi:hypothetical protein
MEQFSERAAIEAVPDWYFWDASRLGSTPHGAKKTKSAYQTKHP